MTKTKTTPHGGSSSHRARGMATATFAGTEAEAEQHFQDAPGKETEDSQDWPNVMEGRAGTSKSEGKTDDQPKQAEGGAQAPPEENSPAPQTPESQPSTCKDPTDVPVEVSTQDPTKATP